MKIQYEHRVGIWSVLALAIAASGFIVVYAPLVAGGLVGAMLLVLLLRGRPRLVIGAWILSLLLVPPWIASTFIVFIPIPAIVATIGLISLLGYGMLRLNWIDYTFFIFVSFSALSVLIFDSEIGHFSTIVTQWAPAFLLGRVVVGLLPWSQIADILALAGCFLALLAVVEFVFSIHPFVDISSTHASYELWSVIQERGGQERSEWSFGHSIALGGTLAALLPFALVAPRPLAVRVLTATLIFGGVLVTLSRGAIVAAICALILTILISRRFRTGFQTFFVLVALIGAIGINSFSDSIFSNSETTSSTEYRSRLLSSTMDSVVALGRSPIASVGPDGTLFDGFASIDNAFLHLVLHFGWIPLSLCFAPAIFHLVQLTLKRSNPAQIAVVSQLPLLATVAMITHHQMVFWFIAGLAAAGKLKQSLPARQGEQDSLMIRGPEYPKV